MNDPRVEAARIRARLWMVSAMHASREQVIRDEVFCAYEVIQAADAADRGQGIHRVRVDDATVERVAEVIYRKKNPQGNWAGHTRIFKDVYRAEAIPLIEAMLGDES